VTVTGEVIEYAVNHSVHFSAWHAKASAEGAWPQCGRVGKNSQPF